MNDVIGYDKDGDEITLIDVLKEQTKDIEKDIYDKDSIKNINKYLKILTKREYEIIKDRYGLFDSEELTQKQIAKKLHISRSYVSRIEKRALIKMIREFIKNNNI